jgi:quinohemoprotein amine dehydrogenase
MIGTLRTKTGVFAVGGLIVSTWLAVLVSGQSSQAEPAAEREKGITITDPLVIAKCGGCHARDAQGNMQRLSWERTTPEGWQDALKQMILLEGLSVTPAEARSIVKYLSSSHGLAPEEAEPRAAHSGGDRHSERYSK